MRLRFLKISRIVINKYMKFYETLIPKMKINFFLPKKSLHRSTKWWHSLIFYRKHRVFWRSHGIEFGKKRLSS